MPANTRKVDRATIYGNPFQTAAEFRCWLERLTDRGPLPALDTHEALRMAVIAARMNELRGLRLACWCKLCDKHRDGKPLGVECPDCAPCHADVLLELANKDGE